MCEKSVREVREMAQTKAEILKALKSEKVRFLRLQITDILGVVKNVEVPESQFEKALDGRVKKYV
jgi:glutamine synthetase